MIRILLDASLGIFSDRYFIDPQRGGFLQREYTKLRLWSRYVMICPKVLILVLYVSDNINADVLNARERVMADKPWCRRCWIESFTSFLAFLQILFWCLQSSYCHSMGFLCVALIKYQSMVIVCSSLLYWKIMYSNICLSSNKQKKRHSELFGFSFKKKQNERTMSYMEIRK